MATFQQFLYNRHQQSLLDTLQKLKNPEHSDALVSYALYTDQSCVKEANVLLRVGTTYDPYTDEDRILEETQTPTGMRAKGELQVTVEPDLHRIKTQYPNQTARYRQLATPKPKRYAEGTAAPRYIQWVTHYGKQVISLWRGGLSRGWLNKLVPAITATENTPNFGAQEPYRQALLVLMYLDQHNAVLTEENLQTLQQEFETNPQLVTPALVIAENQPELSWEQIRSMAETVAN